MIAVSVVIPTFNRAHLIGRAIESVLGQIEIGDEIIVIDDGSTDETYQAVLKYQDKIIYIRQINSGAGAARNRGVASAKNPLIAFLDSDDEWKPGKLKFQRRLMEKRKDIVFSFTDFSVRGKNGIEEHDFIKNWLRGYTNLTAVKTIAEILGPPIPYSSLAPLEPNEKDFSVHIGNMYKYELQNNCIFTGCIVVNRETAGSALHFAEDIMTFEDYECYGRLSGAGVGAYLDIETAIQVSHAGGRLTDTNIENSIRARLKLTERIWGQNTEFLKENRADYDKVISQLHMILIKALISNGKNAEARQLLKNNGHSPFYYRIMAALPAPAIKGLKRIKSFLARDLLC